MGQARFHCATLLADDRYRNDIKSQLTNNALSNGIFLVCNCSFMYINDSNNYLFQQEKLKKRKLILSLPRIFVGIPKLNYFSITFMGSDCKKKECQIKLKIVSRGRF